ncbi:Isotrichodermin C-15 hydroxylase [Madurella mycetomatis]|uniref:Isotrichodermin C-15 hydroxylase n=1 Tax=Madurella mycetomatis TaxID=100816 RepID=A0A175W231_9PEZI|nr:Isotrichodermin C-15 hydroxylase [Madurella mycetomatis]
MEYLGALSNQTYLYTVGALAALYTVSAVIYNLFFHPLASYPGPLLNRATPLRYAWALATGNSAQYAHLLHEEYGPVVRLGPNHLSYVDPRAWRDVYGHRGANGQEEHAKSPTFYRALMPGAATNILDAGREDHSRLRKALSHGFSEKALRSQEGRIQHFVNLLMSKLASKAAANEPVDLVEWYNWVTFDLASDLVFAFSFGCQEKEEDHLFVKLNSDGLAPSGILVALYYIGFGRAADVLTSGLQKMAKDFFAELGRLLQNRLDEKMEKEDLFEGLIQHKDEWARLAFALLHRA